MKNWLRKWLQLDIPDAVFLIRVAEMRPDDVLILSCEVDLSMEVCTRLREKMEETFPGKRCLVMSGGLKLGIVSPTP